MGSEKRIVEDPLELPWDAVGNVIVAVALSCLRDSVLWPSPFPAMLAALWICGFARLLLGAGWEIVV